MMTLFTGPRAQRWLRFIVGGTINTAFTYLLYLVFNSFLAYQIAYFAAYAIGVVFAYWFNATVVFQVPLSWKGLFSYPVVYIIQYILSAFFLGSLIELFQIGESIAPLLVAGAMIPITYLMSKFVLQGKVQNRTALDKKADS